MKRFVEPPEENSIEKQSSLSDENRPLIETLSEPSHITEEKWIDALKCDDHKEELFREPPLKKRKLSSEDSINAFQTNQKIDQKFANILVRENLKTFQQSKIHDRLNNPNRIFNVIRQDIKNEECKIDRALTKIIFSYYGDQTKKEQPLPFSIKKLSLQN